jgi:predicted DCC family thiol-disulfide oxidoreductase YuxK
MQYSHIILFDGVCNLCNKSVQRVLNNDKKNFFHFAALQSAAGQQLLLENNLPTENFGSFVLLMHGKVYLKSTAALVAAKQLSGPIKLLYGFIIVPVFIRDFVYDIIAKNRYKWFGSRDECMVPTAAIKAKFLN